MTCCESVRHVLAVTAIVSLAVTATPARASASAPLQNVEPLPPSKTGDQASLVVVVGCISNERAFRKAIQASRGGFLGTGFGVGNEFVLMNVEPSNGLLALTGPSSLATTAVTAGGVAYQLTGPRESGAKWYVGRRVEILGTLKPGDGSRVRELHVATFHFAAGVCPAT